MSLVYAGVLSHAPGITGRAHLVKDTAKRDELYAHFEQQRCEIEATGPVTNHIAFGCLFIQCV